jgi:hypothetical protein
MTSRYANKEILHEPSFPFPLLMMVVVEVVVVLEMTGHEFYC